MLSVIHFGTVFLQIRGDTPPIIESLGISEKNAVNQQNRILGGADPLIGSVLIQFIPVNLEIEFFHDNADDLVEYDQIGHGDHAAKSTDQTPLDAELYGSAIDRNDAYPKDDG